MKIIVSHDVDHLYWSEHWKDTFIPGLIRRTLLEWSKNSITFSEVKRRLNFNETLNQLESLADFNSKYNVKATFFFGMRKGLNLSYHYKRTLPYIKMLNARGFHVGLHGQAVDKVEEFELEKRNFFKLTGNDPHGIRNHYLRLNDRTLSLMAKYGYLYDSTDYGLKPPYKIGELWEFPIQSMDGRELKEFEKSSGYRNMLDYTIMKLTKAQKNDLPFFVINFHDIYFNEGYPKFYYWYKDLITCLVKDGHVFVNFEEAITELNGQG
ncbi:polysaccharide deacetylase family protein [Fulvivirga lutea]|uniref:Polysaccharide deacetylase n=1 Tax=Fulvivirga lutea TaxID=2810512 RepID=A0A974WGQ9_9BACT|nr:hypothetical protein [Fulvivirga lutea]QSE96797.1 hypothetical protein JR347_14520 [Fulvivirga lutea]